MGPAPGSRPALTKVRDPRDETGNEEESGSNRGLRGGAWLGDAGFLAAGLSINDAPSGGKAVFIGFRVASLPEPPRPTGAAGPW